MLLELNSFFDICYDITLSFLRMQESRFRVFARNDIVGVVKVFLDLIGVFYESRQHCSRFWRYVLLRQLLAR